MLLMLLNIHKHKTEVKELFVYGFLLNVFDHFLVDVKNSLLETLQVCEGKRKETSKNILLRCDVFCDKPPVFLFLVRFLRSRC